MTSKPEQRSGTRRAVPVEAGAATGSVWTGAERVPAFSLSVIVPTRNEADNIEALAGIPAEVIFVDDSDDDTPAVVEDVVRSREGERDLVVSLLHRPIGTRD